MIEYSVWFDRELMSYFNELKEQLKNNVDICTILCDEDNYSLLIAFDESKKEQVQNLILQKITEIVLTYYKPKFILKNLKSQCTLDDYKSLFLQTLTNFDRKTDVEMVKANFSFKNYLFLNSFFNFKLKSLQKKWLEICALTNENYSFLSDENVLLELIKFLNSCVNPLTKQVNVKQRQNKIILENENDQEIELKKAFFVNQNSNYEILLTNIINLAPQKVNVFCSKLMDGFSLNILNNLYGDNFKIIN
jgi:hypothetical protein